jgi:hypothetical protein
MGKLTTRLTVFTKMTQISYKRFNLKILNMVLGKEKYCLEVSHRFAAQEDLDTEV